MRPKEYIEAIHQVIAKGADIDAVLARVLEMLRVRGLEKLYPRILIGLAEKVRRTHHTQVATVRTARQKDVTRHEKAIESALRHINGDGSYHTVTDPTLIGGFVVMRAGKRVDQSYKSMLLRLYRNSTE